MLEEFESKARAIFQFACLYGKNTTDFKDPEFAKKMIENTHKGFVQAQLLILNELLEITQRKRSLKEALKDANRKKSKNDIKAIKEGLEIEEFKEIVMRRMADSIAWQLIRGRSDIAKRLFSSEKSRPSLDESNLSSVKDFSDRFNKENPMGFALITDLTSFIHLGDLLIIRENQLILSEMKEGKKNDIALEIFDEKILNQQNIDIDQVVQDQDRYMAEQIKRMYKQYLRGVGAIDIINKGEGVDPTTGKVVKVQEFPYGIGDYKGIVRDLLLSLDDNHLKYSMLENCLMIGVYRDRARDIGEGLIGHLMKTASGESFPVYNLRHGLTIPLTEPIFLKPFREKDIFDIVFDRTRVFISMDFNHMIEVFRRLGVEAYWLSRKKTIKQIETSGIKYYFTYKGQALQLKLNDKLTTLGDAFITRIVFDNLSPTDIAVMFSNTLHNRAAE